MVVTVSADALAPNSARLSAGTVLTTSADTIVISVVPYHLKFVSIYQMRLFKMDNETSPNNTTL